MLKEKERWPFTVLHGSVIHVLTQTEVCQGVAIKNLPQTKRWSHMVGVVVADIRRSFCRREEPETDTVTEMTAKCQDKRLK